MLQCPNCQAPVHPDDRFCGECAAHLVPAHVAAPQPASPVPVQSVVGNEVRTFEGHRSEVIRVVFSADERHVLSAGRQGDIHIWDIETGQSVRRILGTGGGSDLADIDFSADRTRALCLFSDLQLIDLDTRAVTPYRLGRIAGIALMPGGSSAVYGHADGSIRQIELEGGTEIARLDGFSKPAELLACTPDGRTILSGRFDPDNSGDAVMVWDLPAGGAPRRPERMMSLVSCFAFSADSRRALTGTMDASVFLWDVPTGQELQRYDGHSGNVFSVKFSPAGDYLVSASGTDAYDAALLKELGFDNTIRFWDPESGRELGRLTGHDANVLSVAVAHNGRRVLSGSADRTVRLWSITTT